MGNETPTRFERPRPPTRIGANHLLFELGSGGMGTVHVALKAGVAGFERLVVVKRAHPHLRPVPGTLEMQLDEARVASLIHHPNVASVIDVIEENGELILVQEYHESLSLAAILQLAAARGAPLTPRIVCRIVCDVLAGLHAAHEAKDIRGTPLDVIHRDVKPHNIVVGTNGTTKLIDFGVSKAAFRLAATETGVLKGSLPYLSPEQVLGLELDRRTDIFSAAIVLYEALTGGRLVRESPDLDMMSGILSAVPARPSSVAEGVPAPLDSIVLRALALERSERFQTAAALLEAILGATPVASPAEVATLVEELAGPEIQRRRVAISKAADACAREDSDREPTEATQEAAPEPRLPVELPGERSSPATSQTSRQLVVAALAALVFTSAGWFFAKGGTSTATAERPPPPTFSPRASPPAQGAESPSAASIPTAPIQPKTTAAPSTPTLDVRTPAARGAPPPATAHSAAKYVRTPASAEPSPPPAPAPSVAPPLHQNPFGDR